jgi:hypothetical protein
VESELNVHDGLALALLLQMGQAGGEAFAARDQVVLQFGHATLFGEFDGGGVLFRCEASAFGVQEQLKSDLNQFRNQNSKNSSTHPNRVRVIQNVFDLLANDFLVLLKGSLQEYEFGKFPGPAHGRHVLDGLFGVRFAVAQHLDLLAKNPSDEPIDLVVVVHQQKNVLLAAMLQILIGNVDFGFRIGPPVGYEY